jgi:hypothetical protein
MLAKLIDMIGFEKEIELINDTVTAFEIPILDIVVFLDLYGWFSLLEE